MGTELWKRYKHLGGYVTQWSALKNLTVPSLERALGFEFGSLGAGYAVYGLADRVEPGDFEWRDRTRYSAGWHVDWTIELGEDDPGGWSVQRIDELRAELGKRFNNSKLRVDQELEKLYRRWLLEMNVRHGQHRIVKVLEPPKPNSSIKSEYPNSSFKNVRQWEFRKNITKKFRLMSVNGLAAG